MVGVDDAAAIAVGARHACAVRGAGAVQSGGTVVCWGADDTGQLGDGGGVDQLTPVAVPGITNATAVVAGAGFSCALLTDRTAVCWGDDSDGEIGDGAPGTTPRGPTPVMGLAGARSLAAHWQHACAVLTDGSVVCWGSNTSGQLGDGTTTNRGQPVAVPGLTNVVAVATGLSHSCAMIAGGIRCWGDNSQGELGLGSDSTAPVTQPTLVQIVIDPVAIAAGAQQTCAVRLGGQVLCWGQNSSGQLGEGTMSSLAEPVPVTGLGNGALVSAGATFSCALTHDGAVFCWGDDHYGQLGTGHDVIRPLPTTVAVNASEAAAGGAHTCAIGRAPGGAEAFVCWGSDQAGQLGDNGDEDRSLPAPIKQPLVPAAIAAGAQHSCAIDASAALWCWGRGSSGQLGPGHLVDTPLPIEVALPSGADQATAVTDGDAHTCVLVAPVDGLGGEILCFGDNSYGQLGDGTLTSRPTPALVSLGAADMRAAKVSAGGGHTCAVDVNGGAWCWGRGDSGQLGDGAAAEHAIADACGAAGRHQARRPLGRGRAQLRYRSGGRRLVLGRRRPRSARPRRGGRQRPSADRGAGAAGRSDGRRGRRRAQLRELRRRQRLVLGRQRQRSARRRHDGRSSAAREGRRRHGNRGGRRAAHLRLRCRRDGPLLGRRHQRPARRRRHAHHQRPRARAALLRVSRSRQRPWC